VSDRKLDELYGVPLAEFTATRKRLGLKDATKPTLSAWLVNRLYRVDRKTSDALLALGEKLRHAQSRDPAALTALRDEQAALIDKARATVGEGVSPAVLHRFEQNLRTLSTLGSFSPDAPGRLTTDRGAVGFEAAFAGPMPKLVPKKAKPAPPPKPSPPPPPPPPPKVDHERERAEKHVAALRVRLDERKAARERLDAEIARVEQELAKATRALSLRAPQTARARSKR
jgi:hypothetical protein